jgi:hypothetical protein
MWLNAIHQQFAWHIFCITVVTWQWLELEEGRETEGKGGVGNVRATNETESPKFSLSLRKEECTYNACDILDSHHNSSYCPYSTSKIIFS